MNDLQTAAVAGALLGGMLAFVLIAAFVVYVLLIIAMWKIFEKAGEKGWKSLIPIYNAYIYCKICGINFWIWVILIPVILGVACSLIFGSASNVTTIITSIYSVVFCIYFSIKLGKAFNKSAGFIVGLVLLPNIFHLILGFGKSEYVGVK